MLLSKESPFEEESNDLVTLNNNVCESAAAAESVHKFESMGQTRAVKGRVCSIQMLRF